MFLIDLLDENNSKIDKGKYGGKRMVYVIITLLVIAIFLFGISFFVNDKFSELETEFEQFSISMMQENYRVKKKIEILEEELLSDRIVDDSLNSFDNEPRVINKVHELHNKGYSIVDIAQQTNLTNHDIQTILKNK